MSDTEAFEPTVTNLSLGSCVQRFLCMRGQKSTHVPKKVGTSATIPRIRILMSPRPAAIQAQPEVESNGDRAAAYNLLHPDSYQGSSPATPVIRSLTRTKVPAAFLESRRSGTNALLGRPCC